MAIAASSSNVFGLALARLTQGVASVLRLLMLTTYFWTLPWLMVLLLGWGVHHFTFDFIAHSRWTAPAVLAIAAMLGGVLVRERIDRETYPLTLMAAGVVAQLAFALTVWLDLTEGGLFQKMMPTLRMGITLSSVFALPALGLLGLIFGRWVLPLRE